MRILVTGASRGIGRAIAESLLRSGHHVLLTARDTAKLDEVAKPFARCAHVFAADLLDATSRQGLVAACERALGGLDAFVSSAGIVSYGDVISASEEDLRRQIETNLVAPLLLARALTQTLADGGAMVFIASTLANHAAPGTTAYAASKAGLLATTRGLALELGARGIRVNSVSPGIVETDMVKSRDANEMKALLALHPLGKFVAASDVAEAVDYLLNAQWVTGTDLVLDAGLTLRS